MPRQMHPGPRLDVLQMAIPMNGFAQEGKGHFMAALVNSSSPSSISDRLHFAVTDQNISRFRCSVGKDNRACKNLLGHCSLSSLGKDAVGPRAPDFCSRLSRTFDEASAKSDPIKTRMGKTK